MKKVMLTFLGLLFLGLPVFADQQLPLKKLKAGELFVFNAGKIMRAEVIPIRSYKMSFNESDDLPRLI